MQDISDNHIIAGFRAFDHDITKEYYYGYCRRAYNIYDYKYQLSKKTGLDFFSLAHEYYIQLLTHDFKPLTDKPDNMKLSTWMIRGFHFVVLDALKAYNKEFEHLSTEASDVVLEYVRANDKEEGMLQQVAEAVASHYHDRVMQEVAYMVFYQGFKQKEVGMQLGLTPAAINQRYKKMMEEVVTPFVIENYGQGLRLCTGPAFASISDEMPQLSHYAICDSEISQSIYQKNMQKRITPEFITSLKPNEVFVFGSNLHGIHAGGAARMAVQRFGAEMGKGVGMQGQSYAIPTMQGGVETIKPYVDEFIAYAAQHPKLHFLVTPIGCGIAGFDPEDIAPLFEAAHDMENISLPEVFRM